MQIYIFIFMFWVHHVIDVYMLVCRSDNLSFKVKMTESQRGLILKAAFNEDDRQNDPFRLSNYESYYVEGFVQWILRRLPNMANWLAENETR